MTSPCTPSKGEENLTQRKARLRREKIKARDAIVPSVRVEKSAAIVDRILENEAFSDDLSCSPGRGPAGSASRQGS